jgi:hypothetical protein
VTFVTGMMAALQKILMDFISTNSDESLNNFNNVSLSNLVHDSFKTFATSDVINSSNNNNFN